MKKLIGRFLIFFAGLPLIIILIVFLPFHNHLALNILVIFSSGLGAVEFSEILRKKSNAIHRVEAFVLGILAPLAAVLELNLGVSGDLVPAALILGASWLLVSRVFSREKNLAVYTGRTAAGLSVMIYPGFFMMWFTSIILLAGNRAAETQIPFEPQSVVLLVFLVTVMINDSAAWAAGMLFGKGNRGIVAVSPNKSVAGFIGGTAAAIIAGMAGVLLFPAVFVPRLLPPIPSGLILGFLLGAAASLGDLVESALKRSSDIKDSGSIIPGRGGVLDSIDSIAFAAPVFYAVYRILFGP